MQLSAQFKNVHKSFGEVQALTAFNLDVNEGEFIALLGPSGCGKTTLLRLMAGFEEPDHGEIWLNGKTVASSRDSLPPEKRGIGMVFQSLALWPHMTVYENIIFPLHYQPHLSQMFRQHPEKRVKEVLSMIGLSGFENRYPYQLSGGQQQRVALARAIVFQPSLLLMDEPLSSLDVEMRIHMRKEIQALHRQLGSSILYVTHDQSEALAMADRVVVMREGQMEHVGTPQEIYFSPQTLFVAQFVGRSNLLKGKWLKKNHFQWRISGTQRVDIKTQRDFPHFHKENLLPVRPEQIELRHMEESKETGSISPLHETVVGVIQNLQFQGREWHYTVSVGEQTMEVVKGMDDSFKMHEPAIVSIKV